VGDSSPSDLDRTAEAAVIALACTGDARAFGEIVRRRQMRVRNFMRYLCRNAAEGDDLAQQVFLKAWRSIGQLRSVSAFDGWFKKIMVTTWLEVVRRDKIEYAEYPESSTALSVYSHSAGARVDLDAALAQLPPSMRLCIVLAYDEGMTHEEIAAMTEIPIGTVKSNISRGSARLRDILSDYQKRSNA
jgi:RNA polymerase sigma-70 factor (ECF subfamily)